MQTSWWIVALIAAYLCGSIPFGLLIGLTRGVDIRQHGSRNIGATNTGRVLGRKWGMTCFVLDVLKGLLPVLITGAAFDLLRGDDLTLAQQGGWLATAVAAILGHVAPVWLKFKGGKGVATGLGVILGVYPYLTLPGFAAAITWLLLAATFRYVSLASIVAAALLPAYFALLASLMSWDLAHKWPFVLVTLLMAALVILRHRANIRRLMEGSESRLGQRR